jgi:hypothetical protein
VEGVLSSLKKALPESLNILRLRSLAENIAGGNLASLKQVFPELSSVDSSGTVIHSALVHGFGLVMLYGGVGAWILAAASFVIFAPLKSDRIGLAGDSLKAVPCEDPPCGD